MSAWHPPITGFIQAPNFGGLIPAEYIRRIGALKRLDRIGDDLGVFLRDVLQLFGRAEDRGR